MLGRGSACVLVHGSISTREECWHEQRPLAHAGFQLIVWDRRGYGAAAGAVGEDYLQDARDTAELLDEGAHLVGHSYGAPAAVFAAAQRPERVLSLTFVEPPAFALRRDDRVVASFVCELRDLAAHRDLSDRAFLEGFCGSPAPRPRSFPSSFLAPTTPRSAAARQQDGGRQAATGGLSPGATATASSPTSTAAAQDSDRLSRTIFGSGSDRLWLVIFDAPLPAGEPLAARPWHEHR